MKPLQTLEVFISNLTNITEQQMEFQEIYKALMFNPGQEVQHETVIHQDLIEMRRR
jgi:hypothetical protein